VAEGDDAPKPSVLMDCFEDFKYWYKRHWTYYRSQLLTDYVRVAYLLSPNPKVHADAKENMEAEDKLAMERVLVKLFLPGYIEDNEVWERKKAPMVDELFGEHLDCCRGSEFAILSVAPEVLTHLHKVAW
jgi:hypothetical protein